MEAGSVADIYGGGGDGDDGEDTFNSTWLDHGHSHEDVIRASIHNPMALSAKLHSMQGELQEQYDQAEEDDATEEAFDDLVEEEEDDKESEEQDKAEGIQDRGNGEEEPIHLPASSTERDSDFVPAATEPEPEAELQAKTDPTTEADAQRTPVVRSPFPYQKKEPPRKDDGEQEARVVAVEGYSKEKHSEAPSKANAEFQIYKATPLVKLSQQLKANPIILRSTDDDSSDEKGPSSSSEVKDIIV